MLAEYLPRRFPDRFSMAGSTLTNHSTGDCWDLSDESQDAMETASLLVQASTDHLLGGLLPTAMTLPAPLESDIKY